MKITTLDPKAKLFEKAHKTDAGYDMFALEDVEIVENQITKVRTGVAIAIPHGYYARIVGRSGLTSNTNLRIAEGIIDSDYRGEIMIMAETKIGHYKIKAGDKIAQLIPTKICNELEFERVTELDKTKRGSGGFGSTGV